MLHFLLLGAARTGTTYLQSLLSSHPDARMYWEPLNLGARGPAERDAILNDPLGTLKQQLAVRGDERYAAVGVKMLYEELNLKFLLRYHEWPEPAEEALVESVRQYGVERGEANLRPVIALLQTWPVIHLRRENKLNSLVSLLNARATGSWKSTQGASVASPPPLQLEPETCRRFFAFLEEMESWASETFGQASSLEVSYESLVSDASAEQRRILDFLGLRDAPLHSPMLKQELRPLSETIANFAELQQHFRSTPYGGYFECTKYLVPF